MSRNNGRIERRKPTAFLPTTLLNAALGGGRVATARAIDLLIFIGLLAAMVGCAPTPPPAAKLTAADLCRGWKPILPTDAEWRTMSRETKAQITDHDEHGVDIGCWEPEGDE